MDKKIGFIGLGVMGGPMAKNILEKLGDVTVFDIDNERIQTLASLGAVPAQSIAEAGSACDIIVLSLPSSVVVKDAVLGAGGLLSAVKAGSTVIDCSTVDPATSQEVGCKLGERGVNFLDAPVSGGEKAAIEGTLSLMVGGPQDVFDQCLPVFEAMGTTIVRVGDHGMGAATKLINNMIVGVTFAIVAEGFALGSKAGLDPNVLYAAIKNGWAGSKVLDVAAPAMIERNFKPGGTVTMHHKDLGYALSMAKELDVPTPVTAIVNEVFKAARAFGKGNLAQPAVVTLWEQLLGIEVK